MHTAVNETHQDPNPGMIPLATDGRNPEHRPKATRSGADCTRYRPAARGRCCCCWPPGKHPLGALLAHVNAMASSGPLERLEHPAAIEACSCLWRALNGPPAGREQALADFRRAGAGVTMADFWDLLDDLAEEVGA